MHAAAGYLSTSGGLTGVAAVSASNAWAVGHTGSSRSPKVLMVHWNGKKWSRLTSLSVLTGRGELNAITVVNAKDAWAAGFTGGFVNTSRRTLLLHWNGTAWSEVRRPAPIPGFLNAVTATASGGWAVGGVPNGHNQPHSLALRLSGTRWSRVPMPGALNLVGVAITGKGSAWAIGFTEQQSEFARWNGHTWRLETSILPVRDFYLLGGLAARAGGPAFTVGHEFPSDSSSPAQTATASLSITVGAGPGGTVITGTHSGPLNIGPGVTILSGATVTGPVTIAPGAIVSITSAICTDHHQQIRESNLHGDNQPRGSHHGRLVHRLGREERRLRRRTRERCHSPGYLIYADLISQSLRAAWPRGHQHEIVTRRSMMSGWPSSSRRVLVILGVAAVGVNGLTIGSRVLAFASTRQPSSISASAIPASADECPDVIFIGARGSGEHLDTDKGLGPEVADMEAAVKKVLGRHDISMNVAADPYSADSVDDLKPTKYEISLFKKDPVRAARYYYSHNVAKYIMSIKGGMTNAVIQAEAAVSECPRVLLVLAGYSQGAMVMHQAELKLAADHETAVLKQIAATLLLGDGDRVKKTGAKEFGSSAATAEGVRTWLGQNNAKDVPEPAATANICDAKDIVCDFGISRVLDWKNSVAVHTSYAGKQVLTDAATWAAGLAVSAFQPISLNPGHLNALNAVSAVSPADAWVAGAYCKSCSQFDVSDRTLIGHWDGRSWARIASPNAGVSAFLLGISADSAADGWAVGFFCSPDCGFERPLILRWNGVAWSRAVIPASVQAGGGFLNSVTVVSPSDAWAVGDNGVGTLILRWNGTAWSQAPSPSPGSFPDLASVSADSAKDAWAVGSYCAANCTASKPTYPTFVLHWNGAVWAQVTAPSPSLYNALTGVAAVSPKLAWAAGSTGTAANALLLRWNGTSWKKVSAPNVGSLAGISAKTATYAWALGSISPFLHWTAASGKWSAVDDADGDMQAVSSDAANDAWAVNYSGSTDGIEHWNGKTWSRSS